MSAVLITGGGGYLGSRLARHYAESTDLDVVVTVRPTSPPPPPHPRIRIVPADLGDPDPFATLDPTHLSRITTIVHAAAATRFDLDIDTAHRSNVVATEAVLALAHHCPRLESVGILSTIYSAGLTSGPIAEAPHGDAEPGGGFANTYEQSKWAAEGAVVHQGDGVPWRILRLATVVADDASGPVTQLNAFHRTLDLWFHGLLPVLPGNPETPLYVISGRFALDAITALMEPGHDGVYHLCPDAGSSPALADVIDIVTAAFETDPTFRRRRVAPPLLADLESFDLLAGAVGSFRTSLAGQAVTALRPFARQLYSVKHVETGRQSHVQPDDPRPLVAAACRWLVRTRWGRHAVA